MDHTYNEEGWAEDMNEQLARIYRQKRREPWNREQMTPAKWAMVGARAQMRGRELDASSEQEDWHGNYACHWREEIGAGIVVDVWQVWDNESCDCWEWVKENPRDDGREDEIPEGHQHYGIVAETSWNGREIGHDALWGFISDWPGQDDCAELAYAWDQVAAPVIRSARESLANLPAWVIAQVAAWDGAA